MIVDTLNKPNIAEIYPKPFVPGSGINESPVSAADLNRSRIIYQAPYEVVQQDRDLELSAFMKTWEKTNSAQFAEEFASYKLETDRIPDPYRFWADRDGDLYSRTANIKVKKAIYRGNYLGQMEGEAFDKINQWFKENDQGVAVWVSPEYTDEESGRKIYPDLKIIISEIEKRGTEKSLFNRAIIFDFDKKQSLAFASKLAEFSKNYPFVSSLGQVRSTPFILQSTDWISIMEDVVQDPALWNIVKSGEDLRKKEEALKQARWLRTNMTELSDQGVKVDPYVVQMQMARMLGQRSTSCPKTFGPGTAFQVFANNSFFSTGDLKEANSLRSVLSTQEKEKWDYHRGDCVVCEKKSLEVGPCEICKTCEKTFD